MSNIDEIPQDPEFWMQRLEFNISLQELMAIHGGLCLALRHPNMPPSVVAVLKSSVEKFTAILIDTKALTPEQAAYALREEDKP